MVEFMVLSAPRSGSTWASNWLTTERSICLHDPILEHLPEQLDGIEADRTLGIACTGIALLTQFVCRHPARKVIVHRSIEDINRSLEAIGLTPLHRMWIGALDRLEGLHVHYEHLFDPVRACKIHEHLLPAVPFDAVRHRLLVDMHIDPAFDRVRITPNRARAFRARIQEALAV